MIYLSKLAQQLQGKHQGVDVKVQRASIDTRTLDAGDIFFAITGPNFSTAWSATFDSASFVRAGR